MLQQLRLGTGQISGEPGTPSKSPMWVARSQISNHFVLSSRRHYQEAGLEVEYPELQPDI